MDSIHQLYTALQDPYIVHGLLFALNLLILLFAETLLMWLNRGKDIKVQARALRFGAILFLVFHVFDILLANTVPAYQNFFIRFGLTIATLFGCLLAFNVISYFSRQKFGIERKIDGETAYLDTYNSRLMDLISSIFVVLVAIYLIILIWELEGLLQTTGFLGIVFAFLALTNAIWAPDIYFGLVVLNSNMLEDGDVISLDGFEGEHIISRVSLIYTILLEVRTNRRVLIRNSHLIAKHITNLTKRASADGLRFRLDFNIGYPKHVAIGDGDTEENRFANFMKAVQRMFEHAFELLENNESAKLNKQMPFEVLLVDSGDHALRFALYYYSEPLPNTKVTKTIRQFLTTTPNLIQQAVNQSAMKFHIQLATPWLVDQVHTAPTIEPPAHTQEQKQSKQQQTAQQQDRQNDQKKDQQKDQAEKASSTKQEAAQ